MISLIKCKNILLQGITFQNSPAWNIHPLMCENIIIENILSKNPSYATNGDGLDLESCKNALIINSKFDAGDDGICIKSGKDADGRKRNMPCQNIWIHCLWRNIDDSWSNLLYRAGTCRIFFNTRNAFREAK